MTTPGLTATSQAALPRHRFDKNSEKTDAAPLKDTASVFRECLDLNQIKTESVFLNEFRELKKEHSGLCD
ncbi:MAG: hypothetical protein K2L85_06725 [Paramuribaculum sp.]|nr:hypothetical protein [Paramuribaculum sp.]